MSRVGRRTTSPSAARAGVRRAAASTAAVTMPHGQPGAPVPAYSIFPGTLQPPATRQPAPARTRPPAAAATTARPRRAAATRSAPGPPRHGRRWRAVSAHGSGGAYGTCAARAWPSRRAADRRRTPGAGLPGPRPSQRRWRPANAPARPADSRPRRPAERRGPAPARGAPRPWPAHVPRRRAAHTARRTRPRADSAPPGTRSRHPMPPGSRRISPLHRASAPPPRPTWSDCSPLRVGRGPRSVPGRSERGPEPSGGL